MEQKKVTKEEIINIQRAKIRFLKSIGIEKDMSVSDIVDMALSVKEDLDRIEKKAKAFKSFFRGAGVPGESFYGEKGTVKLLGRATSTMEPLDLRNLLEELGRSPEFLGMVSVKVADARKKLGTVFFDKIAETIPNASITVKIGKKK